LLAKKGFGTELVSSLQQIQRISEVKLQNSKSGPDEKYLHITNTIPGYFLSFSFPSPFSIPSLSFLYFLFSLLPLAFYLFLYLPLPFLSLYSYSDFICPLTVLFVLSSSISLPPSFAISSVFSPFHSPSLLLLLILSSALSSLSILLYRLLSSLLSLPRFSSSVFLSSPFSGRPMFSFYRFLPPPLFPREGWRAEGSKNKCLFYISVFTEVL
jgi:hypothetical protein